jgi:transposase
MIAGLISNRPLCLAHNKMFISREEKEKRVIDLYYNQGKTTHEIIKELRVSPNYVSAVLKKEEEKNNSIVTNNQQRSSSSSATKAYDLFLKGKTPLQVAIALNIRQSEAAKYYREYWKLKRLHKLYSAYKELGDEGIGDFLKLYTRAKKEGVSIKQVVKLFQLADEDNAFGLPQLEKRRQLRIDEIHDLDMQIERSKNHLHAVNDEIPSAMALLNSYHILCERKKQEVGTLNNEISRLESLVSKFKNNNEEYLKIKQTVEEEVRS